MVYISSIVCISLVVVLIQLMMAYQKRAHDLRMMQEPIRRRIRLQKQVMLDAIELLHATSDARLGQLIEEAETYKLETAQSAMVLESWKERMGLEETEETGGEADEGMELLDEDEEFEVLKKKSVELEIPMPIRRVVADQKVAADRGRVAIERGPLVYCLEDVDNAQAVDRAILPDDSMLQARFVADLLDGLVLLEGEGAFATQDEAGKWSQEKAALRLIPYYAWNHRGKGKMEVWIPRSLSTFKKSVSSQKKQPDQ